MYDLRSNKSQGMPKSESLTLEPCDLPLNYSKSHPRWNRALASDP